MQLILNDSNRPESLFKLSKYFKILKLSVLTVFKIESQERWGFPLKNRCSNIYTVMLLDNYVI